MADQKLAQAITEVYAKEHEKSLHFDTTEICDIELNYLIVNDEKGLIAIPAWILTSKTVLQDQTVNYEITAIDAESLDILRSGNIGK